jgi:hypothetical protein
MENAVELMSTTTMTESQSRDDEGVDEDSSNGMASSSSGRALAPHDESSSLQRIEYDLGLSELNSGASSTSSSISIFFWLKFNTAMDLLWLGLLTILMALRIDSILDFVTLRIERAERMTTRDPIGRFLLSLKLFFQCEDAKTLGAEAAAEFDNNADDCLTEGLDAVIKKAGYVDDKTDKDETICLLSPVKTKHVINDGGGDDWGHFTDFDDDDSDDLDRINTTYILESS